MPGKRNKDDGLDPSEGVRCIKVSSNILLSFNFSSRINPYP